MKDILTIYNNNTYREIEIPQNAKNLRIGTSETADFVLNESDFFEAIDFDLIKNETWSLACKENLYISGNIVRITLKELEPEKELEVCYASSGHQAFKVFIRKSYLDEQTEYNRFIETKRLGNITIGSDYDATIILQTPHAINTLVVLNRIADGYQVSSGSVNINGKKVDPGALINDSDFFSVADSFFYYKDNKIWVADNPNVIINIPYSRRSNVNEYPKFTRNTRIKTVINEEPIEILDPPNKPEKPKTNIIIRLLPSVGMLIAAGFMMRMGGYMIAFSLISATFAIITTIATLIDDKKNFKNSSKERIKKYNTYIEKKEEEIKQARKEERNALEDIYISTDKEYKRLRTFSSDLFDRTKEDDDYLCVRLGTGSVKAKRQINYKKQERLEIEDNLQEIPLKLYREYDNIPESPVICDLKTNSAIGICGNEEFKKNMFKNLIFDITTRHYYTDVKIAFIADEHKGWIHDFRMLPHLTNPAGQRNIACDKDSKAQLYEYLYAEILKRSNEKETHEYNIVVFFLDEYEFKSHPISQYVDKAAKLGMSFVFFEDAKEKLPQGCSYIITSNQGGGTIIASSNVNNVTGFTYSAITDEKIRELTRILAPVYSEELSLAGGLSKNLSLYDLLEIYSAADIDLKSRWANSQTVKSLKAPIGISSNGIISLDVSDKADGPHGLVAGTTGSGKSELMLTYVLSMATLYSPYEVGFVIIDFKGGGMANQLENLPHLIGTITNIDGKEIDRSLKSIKAELQKRQRLFAGAKVNHIDAYIEKYKTGKVETPLPHLIIIVDEFAELKAEQPEFMKELISAARIGRSLGVHLILATQKPAGQVDDQIWSNSRFKLCLKVQSAEDSKEVLKSPLAAEIKEPGRAYLQVGNNERFELFQSGYSGASDSSGSNQKEFKVYGIKENGQKTLVYSQKKPKGRDTQLNVLQNHICSYVEAQSIRKLPPICLPPLDNRISFPDNLKAQEKITAEIGIFDDPDNQMQPPYTLDITNENVLITGSSQTGKTNLLQCVIRNLAGKYTADQVNMYIIDFASMFLKTFEQLKHVGGVVTPTEDEKLKNLIKLLNLELAARKELLLNAGVSSYSSYLETDRTDLPQIVLFIDNLSALRDMYFEDNDEDLLALCRDGQSVGICVIATNPMSSGFGYKYISTFTKKIAFFNNDSGEYSSLFNVTRMTLPDVKGRCLVETGADIYECQTYVAFDGEKETDKLQAIQRFIELQNRKNRTEAKRIPEVPEVVTDEYIEQTYKYKRDKYSIPIGLSYKDVQPVMVNLAKTHPLTFIGQEEEKTSCLKHMLYALSAGWPEQSEVYIVDNMHKDLQECQYAQYSFLHTKASEYIIAIEEEAKRRYEQLSSGKELNLAKEPLLVLVINNADALESISTTPAANQAYKNLTTKYKNMNVCILIGQYENTAVSFSAPEILRLVKDSEHFIFFDNLAMMKVCDIPFNILQSFKKRLAHGEAYYIKNGEYDKIKCIL